MFKKKCFRVFVERHFISCEFYDVIAGNAKQAQRKAEKQAINDYPDPRSTAVDNGWHAENNSIKIRKPGDAGNRCVKTIEVSDGIFRHK